EEMYHAVTNHFKDMDGAILSAAVADFTPIEKSENKLKHENDNLTLELKPTPDIAASLGKMKNEKQFLIGFALETNNEEKNAFDKLKKKNFDFIVLNSLNDKKAGFGYDTNKITIFYPSGEKKAFNLKPKKEVAEDIVNELIQMLNAEK
ncbi:MAG TPA: phosphopantothenoylcysteine decarboxylase, partial [Paludibacteraceae bacterium]|nr:phosphopantothenoylcysteine decarboxylase [Paludibacteraceae bacterium]